MASSVGAIRALEEAEDFRHNSEVTILFKELSVLLIRILCELVFIL